MRDRAAKLAILFAIFVVMHVFYTLVVRPHAATWFTEQRAIAEKRPGYQPDRSLFVIIKDPEQESAIILAMWALVLAAMRSREIRRQRALLNSDLMRLPPGFVILPADVREYSRRLEELPIEQRNAVPPRVLRLALKRFGATGDVQDASTTVHNVSESEGTRLDAELSILRFCVWATPAIGFIGTVRGIGIALEGAQLAFTGDTSVVTGGLGIAFNSTLIALVLSIVLMYVLHEIQLAQERLVLDTEQYADEQLVSRMQRA
ncbi:MAG: MotA/TolQ/ExbB proton channel family protein [Steroidobacteraceae bacterium]